MRVESVLQGNEGLIWFGFVYTAVLSLVVVWPLAYLFKKLPGFRDVL